MLGRQLGTIIRSGDILLGHLVHFYLVKNKLSPRIWAWAGSGAFGMMTEVMATHGPDSFVGYMVSTMTGATETTFYVLAVYFGAIGVKKTRHALPSCLMADVAGITAAVFIVNLLFG